MNTSPRHHAILLPGIVMPAQLAYADLIAEFGPDVRVVGKELEIYSGQSTPPPNWSLDAEVEAVALLADEMGADRFHLVGYSGGGAIALAFCAAHPDRLASLTLMEPAWTGNAERSPQEQGFWNDVDELNKLPERERMARFVALHLAEGVEPPPQPDGPPPPWMAQRPAGIEALTAAFRSSDLDLDALRRFDRPVLHINGGKSNPTWLQFHVDRLRPVFANYTVEVFEERHHFDPPHRAEPRRCAQSLLALWEQSSVPSHA